MELKAPPALLQGPIRTARLSSPSRPRTDMLHTTRPLPANPVAQIPGRAGLRFGEELEGGRQESLTQYHLQTLQQSQENKCYHFQFLNSSLYFNSRRKASRILLRRSDRIWLKFFPIKESADKQASFVLHTDKSWVTPLSCHQQV